MRNKVLKIYLLFAAFASFAGNLSAQYATALTVTDIERSLAARMEANASALLTELNNAFFNEKVPQLKKIGGMSKDGKSSILAMWEMTPFRCIETEVIERGLKTSSGWQIRNIPVILKDMSEENSYKEIAINFDKAGAIEGIDFTLKIIDYKTIIDSKENEITDLLYRQAILDFVENFQTAYNRKDIDFISKIYSDDTLIVTGQVVKQTKSVLDNFSNEKISYQVQTKKANVNKLRSIFKAHTAVNVTFDNIEIVRHPKHPEIYGVTFKQTWNTTNYSDKGYWFFLLDFRNDKNMQIYVRIWQPEKLNGKQLSEDEIFKLDDFNIR